MIYIYVYIHTPHVHIYIYTHITTYAYVLPHRYYGFIVHINPIYMFTINKYFLVD